MDVTISEHISLKEFTTFRIGGPARFFVAVKSVEELAQAVAFAKDKSLPIFILGGGSNILMSDEGFAGLVIKMEIKGIEVKENNNSAAAGKKEVLVGAGENWDEFVAYAVEHNLYGIENLSLIPGSVGAAPVQNIGAYGADISETVSSVEAYDTETGQLVHVSNEECHFAYRETIFKKPEGKKYIITRVTFLLSTEVKLNTEYRDIANVIKEQGLKSEELTLKDIRDIVIGIRTRKLPSIKEYGTAGSFFKNPIVDKAVYEELLKQYPELPHFAVRGDESKVKIPAAWVLDNLCGFKGYRDGNVGIYKNQALVIVNFDQATAGEIKSLVEKIKKCFFEKTNLTLEQEVQYI